MPRDLCIDPIKQQDMKRKKILGRLAGGCLVAAACVACSPGAGLEGEWVQPVPGMVGSEQGFSLQAGW